MSGTAGPPPPDEPREHESRPEQQPPYPGWSTQQPQPRGWGDPGATSDGWQQPGSPGNDGWTANRGAAWQIPDAKPGVIPLRPLGVGEILDGAVTTIRRNLGAMLGLSAVVAVATQLLSSTTLVWLLGDQVTEPAMGLTENVEELDDVTSNIPGALLSSLITLIATVFLTGVLTVVVGRAVLGQQLSVTQAWRLSRGRLLRLLGLTLLYTLIWMSPLLGSLVLAAVLAASTSGAAAGLLVIAALFAAMFVGIWLYVRYALAVPALMLETATDDQQRPIRVVPALRRSAALVRRSWWRTFAILLLIMFIVWLIGQVVAVPLGVPSLFGGGDGESSMAAWFILNTLAGMVAATISAPFTAAATALLYVDRRIRREGLDIELARAAGVELPGRGGPGAPPPGAQ